MGWKKLKTRLLLNHPRINVCEDDIELPNGKKSTYIYFKDLPDTATILAQNNQGQFLVQKEYSYPSDTWLYQFPGGGLEDGDTPLDGAVRELSEEANLTGDFTLLGSYIVNNRRSTSRQHVFIATKLIAKNGKKDPGEEFEEYWLNELEINNLIANGDLCVASALSSWQIYQATKKPR